jgi:hypothetical protein
MNKKNKKNIQIGIIVIMFGLMIYFLIVNFVIDKNKIDNNFTDKVFGEVENVKKLEDSFDTSLFENEVFKSLVEQEKLTTTTDEKIGRDNPFLEVEFD